METIEINGWQGRLGHGLAPQELRATLYAITKTCKETARELGISPGTVQDRLDNARYKLGMQRTVRGLIAESVKRGIISPLVLMLCLATVVGSIERPNQRPVRTAKVSVVRAYRQEVA